MNPERMQKGINKAKKLMWIFDKESWEKQLELRKRTRVPCSCYMCGNPRKHSKGKDKLTIQERRELESVAYGL